MPGIPKVADERNSFINCWLWNGEGVTRAHTLESQVHTGATSHYFFHPESSAHAKLESHAHTGQFPGSHVHAEGESHSGGVAAAGPLIARP